MGSTIERFRRPQFAANETIGCDKAPDDGNTFRFWRLINVAAGLTKNDSIEGITADRPKGRPRTAHPVLSWRTQPVEFGS